MAKTRKFEALDLVALAIDETRNRGTPQHAKAKRISDEAVKMWKEQLWKKCPTCGK